MDVYEIAIIGAGPAGLSAALYAARYCRSTIVLHDGKARAQGIPLTHNAPGFDSGISGPDLLDRMRHHAEKYGAIFVEMHVDTAILEGDRFHLKANDGSEWTARTLILATGLELNKIPLDQQTHDDAVAKGVLRYCPVCDGYEHRGARIGVVGCDASGAAEALFLRQFSDDVKLLPRRDVELSASERRDLEAAGVTTVTAPIVGYEPCDNEMLVFLEGSSEPMKFDVIYPALGSRPRSRLARALGLAVDEAGKVDAKLPFGSDVPGLFAAGDVVEGLDQISVAMGHGAIAATKAHNWLRERDGKTVEAVLE